MLIVVGCTIAGALIGGAGGAMVGEARSSGLDFGPLLYSAAGMFVGAVAGAAAGSALA
jgi:hypothetical protein